MKFNNKTTQFKLLKKLVPLAIGVGISSNAFADGSFVSNAQLPTDVKQTCTADITPWFGGSITPNGWVNPANSAAPIFANFADNSRCDFYTWGAQMFLWLTSGDRNKHVFNSAPEFYNISVATGSGDDATRTFLESDGPMLLGVRKTKTDSEIELGQAGSGDVLISQKYVPDTNPEENSLVYYGLHTNDVYALYLTGTKVDANGNPIPKGSKTTPAITSTQFPSTIPQLDDVNTFAHSYGYDIWDLDAMAIELKTSWIDAEVLDRQDLSKYVLSEAVVPIFDRSNPQKWTVNGDGPKTLALVGMHVVGTVNGHPEMIWSTFEHVANVPDATYTYSTSSGTGTKNYDSSGTWNFTPTNAPMPTTITSDAALDGSGAIVSQNDLDIGPLTNVRADPWGDDQSDSSTLGNTTDLVSINVSVLSQLAEGDIRGNYIQTGGIWTSEGQIPPGYPDVAPSYLRGSLNLANTTMETFFQFHNDAPNAFNPQNCFGCHGTQGTPAVEISHIYDELLPLPKK